MRILIYGLNFAPELTGIGKYTGEMAEFLANQGYDVRVVTTPPYYPQWKIGKGYSGWRYLCEDYLGVRVFRCPLWVPRRPGGLKRLVYLASFALSSIPVMLSQIRWRPDWVFNVAPAFMSAPIAVWFARYTKCKSWLHVQDFELDAALGLNLLPGGNRLYHVARNFEQYWLNAFDFVSTISNRMVERLHEKGVASDKTYLFPNWVDCQKIYPLTGQNPLRQELGLARDQIVVLYSGSMGVKQGLEVLVEAARRLATEPDIIFILCGDGVVRKDLEVQAAELPNLRFLPLQPENRLNILLNLADIHVLPQQADAADLVMPSKLTAMLASGRPVIALVRESTEIANVVKGAGLLVPPGDIEALVKAIRRLATDRSSRLRFGQYGREIAVNFWEYRKVLNNFTDKIKEVIRDF